MPPPRPLTKSANLGGAAYLEDLQLPPPSSAPRLTGRNKVLLEMQKQIYSFYATVEPSKIDKAVIALALQLWWDTGLSGLNNILFAKYGKRIDSVRDLLEDFDREGDDITILPLPNLLARAGNKHLLVQTMLKTNTGEYFTADNKRVSQTYQQSVTQGKGYTEWIEENLALSQVASFFSLKSWK